MKRLTSLLTAAFLLLTSTLFAQFPGGGGMGGGGDRGGNRGGGMGFPGMPGQQQQPQQAQEVFKGTGKIQGVILDSLSQKPVEYATIGLFDAKTNQPVDGTTTDQKGAFVMKNLADGDFRLEITFLGYKNLVKKNVILAKGKRDLNTGSLSLAPDERTLNEVTVRGVSSLIEDKVDRLVYNAEKDIANKGGDASDVLRKVPMLTVDLDGNVSLRGNQNIKVLINGKPSSIMAGSVADAMKQIPSDMIKSVEVITSPSAKYDAEGAGGIINIITKKNNLQGLRGSINTSIGNRGSNIFGSINFKYRKLSIGMNVGGNSFYPPTGGYTNTDRLLPNGQISKTRQENEGRRIGGFGNGQLNIDYEINAKNNITLSVRKGIRAMNMTNTQTLLSGMGSDQSLIALLGNKSDTKNNSTNLDLNFDYTRKFDKTGRELTFFMQYGLNNGNNDYVRDQYRGIDQNAVFYREQNNNRPVTKEGTFQLDYEDPISSTQKIEIGAKAVTRHIESNYQLYADSLKGKGYVLNPSRSNVFNYDQNVYATYLTYTLSLPNKWSLKPGARYEYTTIKAQFQNSAAKELPSYGVLVPSVSISKSFKGNKTVRLSFNRRIQRPNVQFLNPNISQSDPLNISFGNPNLNPEFTNNLDLNFSTFIKTTTINVSLFAGVTNNSIESIRFRGDSTRLQQLVSAQGVNTSGVYVNPNALITTFQNIGQQQRVGANFFGSIRPTSKIMINANLNLYHVSLNSPSLGLSNSGMVFEGGGFAQAQVGKSWSLQASAFGRGRQVQLQGSMGGFAFYNFSVQKDFKNKKGNFGIGIDNPFAAAFKQVTTLTSETAGNVFTQNSVNLNYNRGIRFKFTYNFGKMTFGDDFFKRKKSIKNDDQKSGEDSAPQGGGRTGGN